MTKTRLSRSAGRPVRRLARVLAAATLVAASGVGALLVAPAAHADGPTTFANSTSIAIPAVGSANQIGPASPYPSGIAVSGMTGLVSTVTVTFRNLTHGSLGDIDAMVVAPNGANLVVLSDVGGNSLATASNATLTFDDSASSGVPAGAVGTGSYRPTNLDDGVDSFPAPAPTPSAQTTLGGAFAGIDPNGTWQLFAVDDSTGDVGTMAGGWSLTVTTQAVDVATTTSVTTSGTPSTTGTPVTFTASVRAGAAAVTSGTVQFADGSTNLGAPTPLDGSGRATLTTSALAEGTHTIRAVYSGASGFVGSNGSVSQRVDNPTVVNGTTFCNTGPLTIPTQGTATPYPSHITVSGITGNATKVTATVKGLSHAAPIDVDLLLSAPNAATNLIVMSDTGGQAPISGVDLTFDDAAASGVPSPAVSGTYRPTNVNPDGQVDTFPAPAPAPSSATTLATFDGASPNGVWSLWAVDDASGDAGSISGGWCLTVTTPAATTTALSSSVNPSTVGQQVTFTAAVSAGSTAVGAGTVTFADAGSPLASPVPVVGGQATLTTSALALGPHAITATYAGTAAFSGSAGSLTQTVTLVPSSTSLNSSLDPSAFGDSVTFTAGVTAGGAPVTAGTVRFTDDGTVVCDAVALTSSGQATCTTSALTVGTHPLTATFSGTPAIGGSAGSLTQTVAPVADAGGPYTVAEGGSLTLDGSRSGAGPGATYAWDVNGDGTFTDATGVTPTLTWAQLVALGIDDGPSTHVVTLKVTSGALSGTGTASLQVTNTAPTAVVTGDLAATAGTPFGITVGADDPSPADAGATFTYSLDWGDGTPSETRSGPSRLAVTHTYASAGSPRLTVTATDKDGGTSGPTSVVVAVAAAPTSPTTTSPTTTPTTTSPTTSTTSGPSPTTDTTTPPSVVSTWAPAGWTPVTGWTPAAGGSALAATGSGSGTVTLVGGVLVAAGAVLVGLSGALRRRRS